MTSQLATNHLVHHYFLNCCGLLIFPPQVRSLPYAGVTMFTVLLNRHYSKSFVYGLSDK